MVEEKYLELIHGEIDGANSARQSRELQEGLARDVELRKLFEEMQELSETLAQVEPAPAPASLKEGILESIDPDLYRGAWGGKGREGSQERRKFYGYGYAAAAGLLLGLLGYHLLAGLLYPQPSLTPMDLYGSMLRLERSGALADYAQSTIEGPGFRGHVSLRGREQLLLVDLELSCQEIRIVHLRLDSGNFGFKGFVQAAEGARDLSVGEKGLSFSSRGRGHYGILLEPGGEKIRLELQIGKGGVIQFAHTFSLAIPAS